MLKNISYKEALELIFQSGETLGVEKVFLCDALNRIIAEDIVSDYDIPFFDNSAMDGFALRAADTLSATIDNPVKLKIIDEVPAGDITPKNLGSFEAIRIMTGGIIPFGADSVIRKESIKEESGYVYIYKPINFSLDVRKAGEDVKKGDTVIKIGSKITPASMGMLSSLGRAFIKVYRKPTVSVIITGNEILDIDDTFVEGKVRNSNGFTLLGLFKQQQISVRLSGITKDSKEALIEAITDNSDADIIVSTGGVSMGEYDFVKDVVSELGYTPIFWGVRVKPGKPLFLAKKGRKLYIGVPGNPVSTMTTYYLFIYPLIQKIQNSVSKDFFELEALLTEDIERKDLRTEFIRGVLKKGKEGFTVTTTGMQGSGILSSMLKGNCFIIVEEGVQDIKKGSLVPVMVFDSL